MRKIILLLLSIYCVLTSCNDEIDKSIKYNGSKNIDITLHEIRNLNASSEEELNYSSDNPLNVPVSKDGDIKGNNIGDANITIFNSENEINVHVNVSLFREPTLNFGCSQEDIISLYGTPTGYTDSVIYYGGIGNIWYQPEVVWTMSFFFEEDQYYESDLYLSVRNDLRIIEYLNENYYFYDTIITDNKDEIFIYLNTPNEETATVLVGMQFNANEENDICLMYVPYTSENRLRFRR